MPPEPRTRRRLARTLAVLAVSLLAHGPLVVGPVISSRAPVTREPARSAGLAARVAAVNRPVVIAAERRALVEDARADRAAGKLALGDFLLRAGAVDAREQGRSLDLPKVRALWEARLARLRAAEGPPPRAVPAAFGDLHYLGRAGGDVGQALIEGGGSCEPLAQLIVAALHDTGQGEVAWLRFYGGGADGGATHLAPIYLAGDVEQDLLTGTPARSGGALFQAEDLIEVYARAHGLAPPLPDPSASAGDAGDGGGEGAEGAVVSAATMANGYPPNRDRFPGSVPLYADRAVQAPGAAAAGAPRTPAIDPEDCAFFVRVAALDPPRLAVAGSSGEVFGVELRRVPTGPQMDRTFALVTAVERWMGAPAADGTPARASTPQPADRLMGLACLTALYDQAAVGFELRGERDLSRLAATRGRDAASSGEDLLRSLDWASPEGARALAHLGSQYAGRSWILLVLRGGDVPLLRLAVGAGQADWGRISALAALLIAPRTRVEAIGIVESLTQRQKLEVMHEVFHAHDHQRPWASNYALDAGDGEFARVYHVFRGLAWGLWEGARPQQEVLDGVLRDADKERIGRFWVSALIDYYGRNALALRANRPDGPALAAALKRWLRERGFTDLELYRWALAEVSEPG